MKKPTKTKEECICCDDENLTCDICDCKEQDKKD